MSNQAVGKNQHCQEEEKHCRLGVSQAKLVDFGNKQKGQSNHHHDQKAIPFDSVTDQILFEEQGSIKTGDEGPDRNINIVSRKDSENTQSCKEPFEYMTRIVEPIHFHWIILLV